MPTVFAIHANASTHLSVSRAVAALRGTELVGRTASAVEAVRVFDAIAPDAVTVDVRLPDGDGIDLARRLRARRPHLRVVLIGPTTHRLLQRALALGMPAYVSRTAGVLEVAAALRVCLSGGTSFSSHSLNAALRNNGPTTLSPREREVDGLIRTGRTPVDIAARLQVSESTIRTYVARVRAKIGSDGASGAGTDLPEVG